MRPRRMLRYWFVRLRRADRRALSRCHECRCLTDDPKGHASWHAKLDGHVLSGPLRDDPGVPDDWFEVQVELGEPAPPNPSRAGANG